MGVNIPVQVILSFEVISDNLPFASPLLPLYVAEIYNLFTIPLQGSPKVALFAFIEIEPELPIKALSTMDCEFVAWHELIEKLPAEPFGVP